MAVPKKTTDLAILTGIHPDLAEKDVIASFENYGVIEENATS